MARTMTVMDEADGLFPTLDTVRCPSGLDVFEQPGRVECDGTGGTQCVTNARISIALLSRWRKAATAWMMTVTAQLTRRFLPKDDV